jgi:phosphate transport system protein
MTLYSPPVRDLRLLLTIARINSELERIGDQAIDNCEYVERLMLTSQLPLVPDLSRMAAAALRMVHEAVGARGSRDHACGRPLGR